MKLRRQGIIIKPTKGKRNDLLLFLSSLQICGKFK